MALEVAFRAHAGSFVLDVAFATDGGTTAILGPSGAGKTLTLRAIAGLLRPDGGRIAVNGRTLFDGDAGIDVPARKRRVGLVFQEYALFPHLSVADNLAYGLRGRPRDEADRAVRAMVAMLGLDGLETRRPAELSGGERQRVAVGRALAPSPDLLLLDEPFSALDAPTREALVADFASLRSRLQMPAVLVTHDVAEAYALADHLLVLDGGRVLQSGERDAVFHAPSSPAAARLLGVRNLLPGVVVSVAGGTTLIDAGGLSATVRLADAAVGTQVTLGVRAQDVIALPAPDRGDGAGTATLEREVDAGIRRTLALRLPGGAEIQAELDRDLSRKLGRTLPQRWHVQVADDTAMAWQGHSP
ncbi:MAG: ATP-binding cassette domain-containing protein [Chloroflexi bacterium]|nr:ATP-binding cassette domain-containing protein [Chloroflexota bacterium]